MRRRLDWALGLQIGGLLMLGCGLAAWLGWERAAVIIGGLVLAFGTVADLISMRGSG